MEARPKYFDPRTLAKLHGLRLRARHIVEGYVAGLHRSPFKGFSIEFAEHRDYVPGDDVRYVDWRLYGRTDKLFLKRFEDETNLVCCLAVDSSESMHYRGPEAALSKFDYAACLASALAYLVLQQQDAVAAAVFDDQLRSYLRPSGNSSQIQQLLQILEAPGRTAKTSIRTTFHELATRLVKRSVVALFSDLFDDPQQVVAGLGHLHHRRHDVIVFHIVDRAELEFPFRGTTQFAGLEAMGRVVTEPAQLRRAYLAEFERYQNAVRRGCREFGFDYELLPTDRPFDLALARFLGHRAARVK